MNSINISITRLETPLSQIGESPWWDAQNQVIYWIDMLGKSIYCLDPENGETQKWSVPDIITSLVLGSPGTVVFSMIDGVYSLVLETGQCSLIASSPDLNEHVQLADGKTDSRGRFIVGSSHRGMQEPLGKLYALDLGVSQLREIDDDVILANGPCWSPDNSLLYHADSVRQIIYAYDYDLEAGTVNNRREFASTKEFGGIPDGATVDSEGYLWSAICEGSVIVRFNPNGTVDQVIEMPVKLPGSVMFGGPQLDKLYVSTLSPTFLGREADPLDGSLFVIEGLGVKGIQEHRFGL